MTFMRTLLLMLLLPALAGASSIRQLDLQTLTDTAELVFQGRVVASKVIHPPGSRVLRTQITFEVEEVIKGDYPNETLTLSFLGGSLGGRSLRVTDLTLPKVGEEGIYFVESTTRPMVNPLVGWHQGHYLIERTAGQERMTTSEGEPLYGIEGRRALRSWGISTRGAALGLRLEAADPKEKPLTPAQFKAQLQELMQ